MSGSALQLRTGDAAPQMQLLKERFSQEMKCESYLSPLKTAPDLQFHYFLLLPAQGQSEGSDIFSKAKRQKAIAAGFPCSWERSCPSYNTNSFPAFTSHLAG